MDQSKRNLALTDEQLKHLRLILARRIDRNQSALEQSRRFPLISGDKELRRHFAELDRYLGRQIRLEIEILDSLDAMYQLKQ